MKNKPLILSRASHQDFRKLKLKQNERFSYGKSVNLIYENVVIPGGVQDIDQCGIDLHGSYTGWSAGCRSMRN